MPRTPASRGAPERRPPAPAPVLAPILPRSWACSSFGAEAEAMRENWIDPAPIAPAMDVRDADRAKIGTVARVHAPVAVGGAAPDPTAAPGRRRRRRGGRRRDPGPAAAGRPGPDRRGRAGRGRRLPGPAGRPPPGSGLLGRARAGTRTARRRDRRPCRAG